MTAVQARLGAFGISTRPYLDVRVPHFHICNRNGPCQGPTFLQFEAWPVREMVMGHVQRVVEQEARRCA